MSTKAVLSGGAFQDSEGNLLANGYLVFQLSQDGSVAGTGNICAGIEITITLDGSANATAGQSIWGNDVILPVNTFYRVTGYTSKGQPAWGPNNQQVVGSTFNLSSWIPNQIISWTPVTSTIVLENSGVLNSSQSLLNLESSDSSIVITDEGAGTINFQSAGAGTSPVAAVTGHSWLAPSAFGSVRPVPGLGLLMETHLAAFSNSPTEGYFYPTATEPFYFTVNNDGNSGNAGPNGVGPIIEANYYFNASLGADAGSILPATLSDWKCRMMPQTGINQSRYWVGLSGCSALGHGMAFDDPISSNNFNVIGFRYSPSTAGDRTWKAVLGGPAQATVIIDTGIAIDPGVGHIFEIKKGVTSGHVDFLIDGVIVANSLITAFTTPFFTETWADIQNPSSRTSSHSFGLGGLIHDQGNSWQSTTNGITGSGSNPLPASPTPGDTVTDGSVIWRCFSNDTVSFPPTRLAIASIYWQGTV